MLPHLWQRVPGSNGNEGLLHIPKTSRIGALPSDSFVSYPWHSLVGEGFYSTAEMQSAYSTATTVWAEENRRPYFQCTLRKLNPLSSKVFSKVVSQNISTVSTILLKGLRICWLYSLPGDQDLPRKNRDDTKPPQMVRLQLWRSMEC